MPDNVSTTNNIDGGDAAAIIDFAKKRTEPALVSLGVKSLASDAPENIPILIGHDQTGATRLQSAKSLIDEWRSRPERRRGSISVSSIDSFVQLVNRDSDENSVIFADNGEKPRLVAVLNFHETAGEVPANVAAVVPALPRFCDDRIVYPFPLSEEWETWTGNNGEEHKMSQADFAEFIEDQLFDIAEPGSAGATTAAWAERMGIKLAGPAELMRVSRGLAIRVEETVRNVIKRDSGECELMFTVEHKDVADGAPVRVPPAFHIRIPILRGEGDYSIPVRLRYRAGGGKISWFYEMRRPELFLLDAVNEAIARVRLPEDATDEKSRGCGLLVVMGSPP